MTIQAGGASNTSIGRAISSLIADRLFAWDNLEIISQDDIARMIGFEKTKQIMGCDTNSCIAEIAGALDVDYLVTGNIDILGDVYTGSVQLLDIRRAQVKARVPFRSPKTKEKEAKLIERVNDAVDQLVDPFFKKKGGFHPFAWTEPLWKKITARPYRSLMWTSFAVSVGGLVVGGINLNNAQSEEAQYTGLMDQLRSEGKIVGTSGDFHFVDDAAKTANASQLNTLKQSTDEHTSIYIGAFVGAAAFLGLGLNFLRLDSPRQTEGSSGRATLQLFGDGTQVGIRGEF